MFNTILVATDGSDHALKAIETGCAMARELDSDLYLIHTPELQTVGYAVGGSAVTVSSPPEEVAAAAEKVLSTATQKAADAGYRIAGSNIGEGDPAHAIQTYAEKLGADLIITGRRGLGKIGGLLMGSVSQKLGQIAHCAHMTVK